MEWHTVCQKSLTVELFLIQKTIICWHLSIVEQAARKQIIYQCHSFQWLHIHFPSHMHMHTLVKHHLFTFSLYSICHSQCRNGCYILMEKLWSWLIILSLKNGSDTFNTSMCFCLHDRSVILVHLRALWNPFASLSTAEHTYSVLSGVIG